jgi:hypothetical protein
VDNVEFGTNLTFRSVTPYHSVAVGMHTVTVRSTTAAASAAPLAVRQADATPGGAVTAIALPAADTGSSDTGGAFQLQMYRDDLAAPAPGRAKVRVIHTIPGAPVVTADLTASTPGGSTSLTSSAGISLHPVGYGQASPYASIPAGTYQLTISPSRAAPIITGHNWPVSAGSVSSIFLLSASTGPTIEVLTDAGGTSSLPFGGMQTGFGGTAPRSPGVVLPISAAAGFCSLAQQRFDADVWEGSEVEPSPRYEGTPRKLRRIHS